MRALSFLVVCAFVTSAAVVGLAPAASAQKPTTITVMTRNLYLGSELEPIVTAKSPEESATLAAEKWGEILASDFPARAQAIAHEIGQTKPMLVGLQEAMLFRSQTPADGSATAASKVELDFAKILVAALRERGLHYKAVVIATGYDVEVTANLADGPRDIRVTQRDAVLARTDVGKSTLKLDNPQSGQFAAHLTVKLATGESVPLPWAWASIDATLGKQKIRFITTHLDSLSTANQTEQVAELLAGPGTTKLPTVFVGDYNSPADGSGSPAFGMLISGGLTDAWGVARASDPGYSCCQTADIRSATSNLNRRIDLVLFHGDFAVDDIAPVGNQPTERLRSGLWPSDHAGVVATLALR